MINIVEKSKCCGCTACSNICPQKAIEMVKDDEGFLYPSVDKSKCNNCNLCTKICPVLNKKTVEKKQKGYVLNNKEENIRADSTSGGAFTPIAEYVLDRNGVVFGASYNSNLEVIHIYIEKKEELYKLRGSKYVQSFLGDSFKKVKEFLENDRFVCFSGTPCQIEGLKNFLGKDYEKLITVDVMCHAVPSPLVFEKYKSFIKKTKLNNEEIESIIFRDKSKYGFKYSTMTVKSSKKEYYRGVETDPFLRSFFGDLSDRPSCYDCAFKKQYHESDFTIWDCFIAEKFNKKLDDDKGTSRMLVNTEKANQIFDEINNKFEFTEITPEKLTENVKEMTNSVNLPEKRKDFFADINKLDEEAFFKKYFPDSLKVKVERFIRITLIKTGIYKKVKTLAKKILRK